MLGVRRFWVLAPIAGTIIAAAGAMNAAAAQELSPAALVAALRQGGLVLVMRHASSPGEAPTAETASVDNPNRERQLDGPGRANSAAMGVALRRLMIPFGDVLTSPTYRALQTVRFAQLENPMTVAELGDGGQGMQGVSDAQAAWLRAKAAETPRTANTILVTHAPNMARAFPEWGAMVADGESVILRPDGKSGFTLVGRVAIEDWPRLMP